MNLAFRRFFTCFFLAVCVVTLSFGATATAAVQRYKLTNHPDGSVSPPLYGLRLDGLVSGVTGGNDFTFSFEEPSVAMFMDVDTDAQTVRVYGTAYGGHDGGGTWDQVVGTWVIDFTYQANFAEFDLSDPANPDIRVNPQSSLNKGTITFDTAGTGHDGSLLSEGSVFHLVDKDDGNGSSFNFNTDGHRGNPGLNGWGWLTHGTSEPVDPNNHIAASDWLFAAEYEGRVQEIPEPATLAVWSVLGLSVMGGSVLQRRRTEKKC